MILDTCILIDLSRNRGMAADYVTSLPTVTAISVLTVTEVMRGIRRPGEAELTGAMLAG